MLKIMVVTKSDYSNKELRHKYYTMTINRPTGADIKFIYENILCFTVIICWRPKRRYH